MVREGERNGPDAGYDQQVKDRGVVKEIGAGRVFCVGEERCNGVVKCSAETAEGKQGVALCVCTPSQCVCVHVECMCMRRESVCMSVKCVYVC